jgi:hypothetical protein
MDITSINNHSVIQTMAAAQRTLSIDQSMVDLEFVQQGVYVLEERFGTGKEGKVNDRSQDSICSSLGAEGSPRIGCCGCRTIKGHCSGHPRGREMRRSVCLCEWVNMDVMWKHIMCV